MGGAYLSYSRGAYLSYVDGGGGAYLSYAAVVQKFVKEFFIELFNSSGPKINFAKFKTEGYLNFK